MELRRLEWLLAAIAALAFGLTMNLSQGQLAVVVDDIGTTIVAALAGAAGLAAGSRLSPVDAAVQRLRRGWFLIGAAALSWAAGNAVWATYELGAGREAPFPSLADVGYLGFVPLALAGIVLLGPSLAGAGTVKRWLDMALVVVGLGGVGWIVVLSPVAADTSGALEQALSLAYPIGDLLMLGVILSVITLTRQRDAALALLLAGLVFFAAADVSFAALTAAGDYASGGVTAWAWFCGFLLIAVAAQAARPTPATEPTGAPRMRWLSELMTHLPVLAVGALAVSQRITAGTVSYGTIVLLLLVGLLNACRHLAASRQTSALTRTLEHQVQALQEERERTHRVIDEARDPYVELDREGRITVWNGPAEVAFGWHRDEVVGKPLTDIVPPARRAASQRRLAEFLASRDASIWGEGVDVRYVRPDGIEIPIEIAAWQTGEGDALRVHAFVWDISERRAEQEALEASERRWQALVRHSSDITLVLDAEGRLDQEMPTVRPLFGYQEGENQGRHFAELIHPQDLDRVVESFARVLAQAGHQERERLRVRRFDGSWVHVEAIATNLLEEPTVNGIVCNLRDITAQVAAENELKRQARRDPLTGLPNRNLMTTALADHCAEEHEGHAALLLMDLDGFKDINDGLGHDVGDQLLVEIGHRLDRVTRADDVVARLGGDEFAVLVTRLPAAGHATRIAEGLGELIREPVRLGDVTLEVGVSIGIADCVSGDDPLAVLQRADVAMYRAKRQHSGFAVYGSADDEERRNSVNIAADLRCAIDQGDLVVHYQPKMELATGIVDSVEALVRWQHPERGLLPPDEFIALAERTGLIRDLTTWVLSTALHQCALWRAEGLDLPVAVNLSPRVLSQSNLVNEVREALETSGVPAGRLTFEITESAFPENTRLSSATLDALGHLGVRLSVDDFGTGWSSLSKLKELPVQELKIDKSFVLALAEDATDHSIVRSILDLARSLGLTVVAEGVETESVLDQLVGLGCPLAQGYFFSRPIPGQELTGWILDREQARRDAAGADQSERSHRH